MYKDKKKQNTPTDFLKENYLHNQYKNDCMWTLELLLDLKRIKAHVHAEFIVQFDPVLPHIIVCNIIAAI